MPNSRQPKEYVAEWKRLWEADLEAMAFNGTTCDPTKVNLKVLEWVKENCAQKPHFVKVLNKTAAHGWTRPRGGSSHSQCRLFVPQPFVKEHFKQLGRVTTLENAASHSQWKVSLGTRPKQYISWMQGWKQVADDNHLQPGDVMIFILVGDSHFEFYIFDEDGHPKQTHQSNHTIAAGETLRGSGTSHHNRIQNDSITDAEVAQDPLFQSSSLKKRRLFDPDILSIAVKSEPGTEQDRDGVTDEPQIADPGLDPANVDTRMPTSVSKSKSTAASRPPLKQSVAGPGETEIRKERLASECATTKPRSMHINEDVLAPGHGVVSVSGHGQHAPVAPGVLRQVGELPFDPLAMRITSRRRVPTVVERKRAREVARAHADVLVGFRFVVVLAEHHVYRDFRVLLSQQFVTDSKLPKSRTRLRVVDAATGKSWAMYSEMTRSSGQVAFDRRHWGVFSLEHFLEEGDVVVFQLKSKEALAISVRIFRVLQLPKEGRYNCNSEVSIHDHYDIQVQK